MTDTTRPSDERLRETARRVRTRLVELAAATTVHLGPGMSVVDILVAAYAAFDAGPGADNRPHARVIMSKGHAAAALYFVLQEFGILTEPVEAIGRRGDTRAGHPTDVVEGVEIATGALGHGLAVGAGMALAARLDGTRRPVVVVVGDGELNEGSVWEAAAFAAHRRLSNLRVVVDRNGLQQSGPTRDILDLEPLDRKWESFGWRAVTVDGHDIPALMNAIEDGDPDRPSVTVARTVKGKGVEFMENDLRYHQLRLDAASHRRALAALADRQPVHAGQVGA